jgi:hypothetical protein
MRLSEISLVCVTLAALGGCPKARTSAATQSTGPKMFDVAASDPNAIKLVDGMVATLGGDAAWQKAHQISFHEVIMNGTNPILDVTHTWDRWNGRHHYETKNTGGQAIVAGYDIYEGIGFAKVSGHEVSAQNKNDIIAMAKKRFPQDVYPFTILFRLKDPGVHLGKPEDQGEPGTTVAKWDSIKVTFDQGVGTGDTYYIYINRETHMPDQIHKVDAGQPDDHRIVYELSGWTDVGGLKWPTKKQNAGLKDEVITFDNIKVTESTDSELYVPEVK